MISELSKTVIINCCGLNFSEILLKSLKIKEGAELSGCVNSLKNNFRNLWCFENPLESDGINK